MDGAIQQQRVQHIIDSYALAGREAAAFEEALAVMLDRYSYPLVEWALAEALVQNWLRYPLPRGLAFLQQVEACLQAWLDAADSPLMLTAEQFEHVTGLTPPGPIQAAKLTQLQLQARQRSPQNSSVVF